MALMASARIFAFGATALLAFARCSGGGGTSAAAAPQSPSVSLPLPATSSTPSPALSASSSAPPTSAPSPSPAPTATALSSPSPAPSTPTQFVSRWNPAATDTFQWQLSGTYDSSISASVYDVDAFETSAATIASLHASQHHVVCYLNAGAYENYRPDASSFPSFVLGSVYNGYPDERWLDIRQLSALAPIMDARLDLCRSKGFDAVEPDNIDGYTNATGFPLQASDQTAYNGWFAQHAHARGLSIALKNDGAQAASLIASFDFVLAEDCWFYAECSAYAPFVNARKAVFTVEYTDNTTSATFHRNVCPPSATAGMTAILKNRSLDAYRDVCP